VLLKIVFVFFINVTYYYYSLAD